MPKDKSYPSIFPGLHYDVPQYVGSNGFIVQHEASRLPAVNLMDVKRPATDFVRWANATLGGVDWTLSAETLAGPARTEYDAAIRRFRAGLEYVEPKYPQRRYIQVKPSALKGI